MHGVLGLDLAARWGWAYIGPDGSYRKSGVRQLRASDGRGERMHVLMTSIADLVTRFGPDFVVVEAPIKRTGYPTARSLYGYAACAEIVAHVREVGYAEMTRAECLQLVGTQKGGKAPGVSFCRQFKPDLTDDNEADAILVALAAHERRESRDTRRAA